MYSAFETSSSFACVQDTLLEFTHTFWTKNLLPAAAFVTSHLLYTVYFFNALNLNKKGSLVLIQKSKKNF